MNDKKILTASISLLKHFAVNSKHQLIFINNENYNNYLLNNINYEEFSSMIVLNYDCNKLEQEKQKINNEKKFDIYVKKYYEPFVIFDQIKLFQSINYHFENNLKNIEIFENILEFYYLCFSKNILFLKGINLEKFLDIILKEKDIIKISNSKKITNYLLKILSYIPYQ